MSVLSKGFNCFGRVVVLVSGPPKLLGGEWKVAVGEVETLRLRTARSGLFMENAMSFAGVPAMIKSLLFEICLLVLLLNSWFL